MDSAPRSPILAFFLVAGVLYAPVAIFAGVQVLPNVSLFNLGTFIPATAALILVYRENKGTAVRQLMKRAFDFRRIESKVWYFPVFLMYPSVVLVQYGLALVSDARVSPPTWSVWIPLIFIVLFIAAAGEELGWMGYLFEPMEERFGTLKAAILMGVVWAAIHIPLFASSGASATWIASQLVYIAAARVLFVWVYSNTGKSVFAVIAMHTMFNVGWQFFPPSAGLLVPTFYDPRNLALTTLAIVAVVLLVWGPSLVRYRYAKAGSLPG